MAKSKLTQKDFRAFESLYNRIRKANKEERLDAVGLLTPKLLKEHLKSGKDLVLAYGRKGHTVTYTLTDLLSFSKQLDKAKNRHESSEKGVTVPQLERVSLRADKIRMQTQIRNATLYRVKDNILHFSVSASGENGKTHHQVRVRLEEWRDFMTGAQSFQKAARFAAVGRISFDCSCGRHQFWFRYLAGIGGFALEPPAEKDFPKIRNPRLRGACCKHVLKVLQQLKSPSVHNILSKHMEKQAEAAGYGGQGKAKFLNQKELAKAQRARGSSRDAKKVQDEYENYVRASKAYTRKIKDKRVKRDMEKMQKQLKVQEAKNAALKARNKQLERQVEKDKTAAGLRVAIDMAKKYGVSKEQAIKGYSQDYKMDQKEVELIAEEYNL